MIPRQLRETLDTPVSKTGLKNIPIPLLEVSDDSLGVCDAAGVSSPDSGLMVDVEEERVKLCVKGARCVSLSS